ncbi:hypothetical protein C0J52_13767 [Blattella germanica]|nr:hypothetical protein C0J52_13767 [Blattella germanica]
MLNVNYLMFLGSEIKLNHLCIIILTKFACRFSCWKIREELQVMWGNPLLAKKTYNVESMLNIEKPRANTMYSVSEQTDMHYMYGRADGNSARPHELYAARFPNRQLPCARIHQRLRENGTFDRSTRDVGRPSAMFLLKNQVTMKEPIVYLPLLVQGGWDPHVFQAVKSYCKLATG